MQFLAREKEGQICGQRRALPSKRDGSAWFCGLKIKASKEIGLLDMFWGAIDIGGVVVHPTLGRGRITHKTEKPIKREGYIAKLITVQFDGLSVD